MMKITSLSHLFKWENLHNWWLTKYFFAPLYVCRHSFIKVCKMKCRLSFCMVTPLHKIITTIRCTGNTLHVLTVVITVNYA